MYVDDTIAAISTSLGEGGIGIVRMSGEDSLNILNKVFKPFKGFDITDMKSHTVKYGFIKKDKEVIDEVIVIYMKAPRTYTREDVVEVNCHGGMIAVQKILSVLLENGARLAEPGEFTKRAFLNGRIDLSQAEAVMDLIKAKTNDGMRVAVDQAEGKISKKTKVIMKGLLSMLAHIEASVDFPEDDIDDTVTEEILSTGRNLIEEMQNVIESSERGKILREGISAVIVGKPNVGKSSLLNVLLNEKRAIVTDVPGTTRDVIEEYVNIGGIPVKLMDTAGIRETDDIVESIGVSRSKEYIKSADIVIYVFDADSRFEEEDDKIVELIKEKKVIVLVNKIDLNPNADTEIIENKLKGFPIIHASVINENGISDLEEEIKRICFNGEVKPEEIYITNIRHRDVYVKAVQSINNGICTIESGFPLDMASIEFKEAYLKLGEITGDTVAEDIIDKIFKDFCIGK